MKHYLFLDHESGEEFIVGASDIYDAITTASELFDDPEYLLEMSDFEAEASGFDEY